MSLSTQTSGSIWRQRLHSSKIAIIQHANFIFVSEDNEAEIKQINEGNSPTMRHISRTHRVDFDWLHHRINVDPQNEIKYVNTTEQLVDIHTKKDHSQETNGHN